MLTLTADDGKGGTDEAQVEIVVANIGAPPTFNDSDHAVTFDITAPNARVLATLPFTEPDGDEVTASYQIDEEILSNRPNETAPILQSVLVRLNNDNTAVEIYYTGVWHPWYLRNVPLHVTVEDEDGSDSIEVTLAGTGHADAPVFEPDDYVFLVTSATENGDEIGSVFAFDPDGPDDQIKYSVLPGLDEYISVGAGGVVTATDASALRNAIFGSEDGANLEGSVIATDKDGLSSTATVTVQVEDDAEDIADRITQYLILWRNTATTRATNFHAVAQNVINTRAEAMYAAADSWGNEATNLLWGFTSFAGRDPRIGIGANAYDDANISNVDQWKAAVLSAATSALTNTTSAINDLWNQEINDWVRAKADIDGETPVGSVEHAQRYLDYLVELQQRLEIVGTDAPTEAEVAAALGI